MATIETSATEEYTLFLPRGCLLQCLNIFNESDYITEPMLSEFVEQQQLIGSNVRCIYEISSGLITHIERQNPHQIRKNGLILYLLLTRICY